ncbi:MAG: hypothetical protein A3B30_01050 [Candidatus Komeilibacteria bacterium RIFCSPLOWO2_01_FULL_52_15]|uniref:Uncharacterized protein n=2 Tax=Candidatus Komeiliibacteriota TaxID=1817908 RepID=A0A1G2BR44_9BACT|nr:MAG: hypothetical protein A2677_00030 [Candidatus Komeilibacteria bacterium RIFCSPHIGHO2_01_FULL_52_14]OGY91538.1 MAG: hypothetical protein A3B30_01050 [Candidatus Komeilibacteria bacterium RIFCSPLOWO2_01_FULL_52_15]
MVKTKSGKLALPLGQKFVWLAFGIQYLALFAIISSDRFDRASARIPQGSVPLNIALNSISLALAACGVLALYHTSRHHARTWRQLESAIYSLLIIWMATVIFWIVPLIFFQ